MSSILDALNKRPTGQGPSADSQPLRETRASRLRGGGSGLSLPRIALWVITTVAVGAFTGLFLVYRLAALGMASPNPLKELAASAPVHPPETPGAALAPVSKDAPAVAQDDIHRVRQRALEAPAQPPSPPAERAPAAPAQPVDASLPAAPPATLPEAAPAVKAAERVETAPDVEAEEFYLKGIMLHADRPMAIINGRLVAVGERVEGRKVLAISRNGVRLEGRTALLQIHE